MVEYARRRLKCCSTRHCRTEENREAAKQQSDRLRPRPVEERRTEGVVNHAQDGVRARVDDRHRVQQRCHGRRGDRSRRQPCVHRENSRFRAETDERQQKHEFQQFFHPADFFRVQHAAEDKVRCRAVVDDEHQRNERQRRAGDGEGEVLAPCADGHGVLLVDDKRQGNQRQALIKDVEREQVRRERDGQRDGVAHRVVAEERVRTLLVLHVLKAVQRRQRPEDGYQTCENAAHAVHTERKRQLAVHVAEDVGGIRAGEQQHPRQDARRQHDGFNVDSAGFRAGKAHQSHCRAAKHGQRDGQE